MVAVDLLERVVLRWDSASSCAALLEPGGIDAVWLQTPDDTLPSARAIPAAAIRLVTLEELDRGGPPAQPGEAVAVKAGLWPGARAAGRGGDAFVAGATARAWVDANGYLVAHLRALYPQRPPVLAYLPDKDAGIAANRVVSFDSLELALIDSWCAGGNYILAPDAAYRDALLAGKEAALASWKRLGRTARWLKERRSLFRRPPSSAITVLVEPGEATREIANLLCRHSASPDLVSAAHLPAPDPTRRPVVVAAGLQSVSADLGRALLAHARAGATVVTDNCEDKTWWKARSLAPTRKFEDREFYAFGSGRLVAYKDMIADPGDFAQDVLDLAGARRPARLWTMSAAVARVSQVDARSATLWLVNYGSPARSEIMVHVRGAFNSATLSRPEADPVSLRTSRRGAATEIMLPALSRLAVVEFA